MYATRLCACSFIAFCGWSVGWAYAEDQGAPFSGEPAVISPTAITRIEAEDFDKGPQGTAYNDREAINSGAQYRKDGVDLGKCTDTGGGYRIGWIAKGEWQKYTIRVERAGKYTFGLRTFARASAMATAGQFHVEDENGKIAYCESTCAICLVQGSSAYWAHVGDSRVYQLRGGEVFERTRDHSHVELLLRAGRITEKQALVHPMRNYVECCIGGDPVLPEMTLSGRRALRQSDVLLLCSDGLWSGLTDEQVGQLGRKPGQLLRDSLVELGQRAVTASAPFADNTTAAAIRWLGP